MRRIRLTASVVLVGLVLTAAAAWRVAASQRSELQQRVLVDAVAYAGALEGELERHVGAAYALRDLFDDGPVVSRARYERAIEALGLDRLPAVHGLNVVRPVEAAELPVFLREKRAGGYLGYTVEEPSGAEPRRTRWVVSLVAPHETNEHLLGRDLGLVPELAAALERSRDLGEPTLGPAATDADASGTRLPLVVPVYGLGEAADTVAARQDHLAGWVVSTLSTSALVDGAAPETDLEIVVLDDTTGREEIGRAGPADGDHDLAVERSVDLYGRRWTVRAAPGPGYLAGIERYAAAGVLALGLLLTAAFGALVHVLGQRSAHARRLAEIRTRELADTNDQLSAVNGELALRLGELNQHAAVDRVVQRAAFEVSQARTVQDALERLRIVLLDVASFDRVGFSIRIDDRRMRVRDVAGPAAPIAPAGIEYVASRRVWESFTTRDLVVVRDTTGAAVGTLERVLADRGIGGIVTVPLVARGEVAGILTLGATSPLQLSAGDVQLLSRVTDGIAGPIATLLGLEAERQVGEQLRHLDELKDEFLGVVAHDLKGPLSVFTGYTDLLLAEVAAGPLEPDLAREALSAMQRAASNQQRLIADLLESQRLALGVAVPTCARIVVAELVRETIRDLAAGADVRVTFDDRSDEAVVSADVEWLRRVVTNLATNAWRYGSPDIVVRVTRRAAAVRVEIIDHGAGIPPADLPRLFQRFSRLTGAAGSSSGTGLGLYICKQLIEAHDGEIGVESTVGVGTNFWFTLPIVHAQAAVPVPAPVEA